MGSCICLSCLLSKLWSWECQIWLIVCIFCWWQQSVVTVMAKYLGKSERTYLVLSENAMVCWILMVISKISILENVGFSIFADLTGFVYFYPQYLTNSNPKSIPFFFFWKNSVRSFICTCPNLCHQQKIKICHFGHFNDDNIGSKHDNEINVPIFFISSLSFIGYYILFFAFRNLKSSVSWGSLFGLCSGVSNAHFMPKITFLSLLL